MERLTFEYGHKSKPEVISPERNNRDPLQKLPEDEHSPSPAAAIVTAKGRTEPPKPGLNGKCGDSNISEKISRLITRLPQLGKGIRIKKGGEYIPLDIPETTENDSVEKNDNETRGKQTDEEIEGYDLEEINDNASYWTSGYEEEDERGVVPKYGGDPPVQEEEEMPLLGEAYVPEDLGGNIEQYDPTRPAITTTDTREAPSLLERFARSWTAVTAESRPPVLEPVTPLPDPARPKSTHTDNKNSKDTTHSPEFDELTIEENETERTGASEVELFTEADLKSSLVVHETPTGLTSGNESAVDARAIVGKSSSSNERLADITRSSRSSSKSDRLDGGQKSRVESPEKHRHRHKTKKHHKEKHSKHERRDSELKLKGGERDSHKNRRSKSKDNSEKSKTQSREESKDEHKNERNKSEEKHSRDSRARKEYKHKARHHKKEGRQRHDSEERKSRSDRGEHGAIDRRNQSREDWREAEYKKTESESDGKKNNSKERRKSRDKSKKDKFNRDPSQKLIVDTFDFFSLPVKKPKPETKIAVDARRTVPLPSSACKHGAVTATKSKCCQEPRSDKESKEDKSDEVVATCTDVSRTEPAGESPYAVSVDGGSVDSSQNSAILAEHSTVKSHKESNRSAASIVTTSSSADRPGSRLDNVKTVLETSLSTGSDSTATVPSISGILRKRFTKTAAKKQTNTEHSDSSEREAKRPRKGVSLKRRGEDCEEGLAFPGHKRLNRGGGIRRNQIGRNTPRLAKRRRTDLTRGNDEFPPPDDGNNLFNAKVEPELSVALKEEVVEETASPAVNARPSRNRSTPVRYSPLRRMPKSAYKPLAPESKLAPTRSQSPSVTTSATSSEPSPKAKRRVKAPQSKESKTFSECSVLTDSISEPHLSFLKQHNVAEVLLRFRTAPLAERTLKVDLEAESRFRYPSTMFPASRHGYALVNKKKLSAGMRAFSARAYNGSLNVAPSPGTTRKWSRKNSASPIISPQKAVKSPLKSPAKVMKLSLKLPKSPLKPLKSPVKEKRSPLKLKISHGKLTLTTESTKEAKINKSTELAESRDLEKTKTPDPQPASPLKKVKNVSKLSPLAKSKKAFVKRKSELTAASTSIASLTETTKEKAKLRSPKTSPTTARTPPNKTLKSSQHIKQAKLSPFLKATKQWPTSPSPTKHQHNITQSPLGQTPKPVRSPLMTSLKANDVEPKANADQLSHTSQSVDDSTVFVQLSIPDVSDPLTSINVTVPVTKSSSISSENRDVARASLDTSLADIQPCSFPSSYTPSYDDILPLDELSVQDVMRTLQLDLDPVVMTENSTTDPVVMAESSPEVLFWKPKRRPKLPQKLRTDVIMHSLVKKSGEKLKTAKTEPGKDFSFNHPEVPGRTNNILLKPAPIRAPGGDARSVGTSISVLVNEPRTIRAIPTVAPAQTRVVMATKTPIVHNQIPTPRVKIISPFQQQTIKDLFKMVQLPKKSVNVPTVSSQSPAPERKRRGRPPGTPSRVSAPCASPKTPMSPKSPLISKLTFSPKTLKSQQVDQKKIRLQQKSKKLLKDSLRNARQKVVAQPSPKLPGTPLLLGDRKRLSRGAKERVITYNENLKTKTVDDVENESPSSASDIESDNESELASLRLDDDLSSTNKLYRILDTLEEHICLVDGLVSQDFDMASRKFLSNPVALLYNAEIRLAASTCSCLCFYEQASGWNDNSRTEVPQQSGLELTEKHHLQDFGEAPDFTFDFSQDRSPSKRDRNIFDLIASPDNDGEAWPFSDLMDVSSVTSSSRTILPKTENADIDAVVFSNSRPTSSASKNQFKKTKEVKRANLKSILNCDLTKSNAGSGAPKQASSVTRLSDNNLPRSEARKRACPQSVQAARRPKSDFVDTDSDGLCESPLFERLDLAGSDLSISSADTNMDELARSSHYRRCTDIMAIRKNPGKLMVQDIDLLMNVCEALEVFLTSEEHLLLDVGGYMSKDQALMLGYLCDYEINTQEKALKLKRTSQSRLPDASDLDAVINNGVYLYGAGATSLSNVTTHTSTTNTTTTAAANVDDEITKAEPAALVISSYPRAMLDNHFDSGFVFY